MKKLASNLPLQDMIRSVVAQATEKVASDSSTDKKVQKLVAYEKKEHGHIPTPAEEEAEHTKTASDANFIEKLASAVDFIAANIDQIEIERPGLIEQAISKLAQEGSPVGPGKGPGALEVMKSIGGTQGYKKDKPRTADAAASQAGAKMNTHGLPSGATLMENDMEHAPGQSSGSVPHAKYPEKGVLKTASNIAREHVLRKLAGEDVMKASISSSRTANPLAGMGELTTTDASQSSPSQAGDHGSGYGNQARRLIASNKAAIDATKGSAKGPVKTQLKEVLEEPALNASTDSKLKENLRNTGKAGVKIAAARAALEKIASEGCKCDNGSGECSYCQLKSAVRASSTEKTAGAMMGGMGAAPTAPPPMSGGMSSMADAGASADGCQCGGTGECRVCKLKAALAAAKASPAGMAGMPVEKDSNADVTPPSGMY